MASIIVDGEIYRIVGMLDDGFMMAVMDINDIGRVLVRDQRGSPWSVWSVCTTERSLPIILPTAPPEEPEERPHR